VTGIDILLFASSLAGFLQISQRIQAIQHRGYAEYRLPLRYFFAIGMVLTQAF